MVYPYQWAQYPPVPYPVVIPTISPRGSPRRFYGDEYYRAAQAHYSPPWPGYAPLPPSPSFLPAWIPLPPSHHTTPTGNVIPLPPPLISPSYPPYLYPHDPYFIPAAPPPQRIQLHPLINGDSIRIDLVMDLSAPTMKALMRGPYAASHFNLVHPAFLNSPATVPPTTRMQIKYPEFSQFAEASANEWAINVGAVAGENGPLVTVSEVLNALHSALRAPVTQIEWSRVPSSLKLEVAEAYTRRCRAAGAEGGGPAELERELGQGVRRVDFLRNKVIFGGLQRTRDDDNENFKLLVREK